MFGDFVGSVLASFCIGCGVPDAMSAFFQASFLDNVVYVFLLES